MAEIEDVSQLEHKRGLLIEALSRLEPADEGWQTEISPLVERGGSRSSVRNMFRRSETAGILRLAVRWEVVFASRLTLIDALGGTLADMAPQSARPNSIVASSLD